MKTIEIQRLKKDSMLIPRLVPAAVTPLPIIDILRSILKSLLPQKNVFHESLTEYFNALETYTFTSLMRTVYASLFPLRRAHGRKYVILPRYSCPSFAHGILANNLEIRYVDQNPETLSYDISDLRKKLDKDVLAIIVPHYFGLAHPIDVIVKMAESMSVVVIEGVDYSIGSIYKGKKLGTFGDIGILNFQEGKAIPVGGGALFVRSKELFQHYLQFKDTYRPDGDGTIVRSIGFAIGTHPSIYYFIRRVFSYLKRDIKKVSFEDTIRQTHSEHDFEFSPDTPLFKLNRFQETLGLLFFSKMKRAMEIRRKNAQLLEDGLLRVKEVMHIKLEPGLENPHFIRYPIRVDYSKRDSLIKRLHEHGIEASSMYTDHGMNIDAHEYPGAKEIYDTLVTLPVHPYCTKSDIEKTVSIVSKHLSV